jgi:hypothetical protein
MFMRINAKIIFRSQCAPLSLRHAKNKRLDFISEGTPLVLLGVYVVILKYEEPKLLLACSSSRCMHTSLAAAVGWRCSLQCLKFIRGKLTDMHTSMKSTQSHAAEACL